MTTEDIIETARRESSNGYGMNTSAKVALEDAEKVYAMGNYRAARKRAIDSLAYSVGVFSRTYRACCAASSDLNKQEQHP